MPHSGPPGQDRHAAGMRTLCHMTQRLVVPDLARGLALLGIAMANITAIWVINDIPGTVGTTVGGVDTSNPFDVIGAFLSTMFIHVRGLPMFSTLLGFGVGLLCQSLERKNYPPGKARRVLVRRYFFLALFGLAHMFLIFHGDIMFTYGLAGMVIALLINVRTWILRVIASISIAIGLSFGGLSFLAALGGMELEAYLEPTSSIRSAGDFVAWNLGNGSIGAVGAFFAAIYAVIELIGVMLIGFIWARTGVLANPAAHRRTLIAWASIAVAVMVFIGIPWGLGAVGVLSTQYEYMFMGLNLGFGLLTGPGILAIFALLFDAHRTPSAASPFIALGKRSMSGYLAQSFLFIALTMPFMLGLGQSATVSGKLLIAFVIWLITVLLAVVLEAKGAPGPFEWAHRRLSYGRTGTLEPYSAVESGTYNGPHEALRDA